VRGLSYTMEADVRVDGPETRGVPIAHGDATSGYSLYVRDNRLVHDLNIGGTHVLAVSDRTILTGNRKLGIRMRMGQSGVGLRSALRLYRPLAQGHGDHG
jgi:arylsulfatase